jgi:(p)ppGpp synthase/HD superfamily hydrolase
MSEFEKPEFEESSILETATRIAVRAHATQKRKEGDLPYVSHPFMVALKLAKYDFPDEIIAAALVHDVLEDTDFGEENLRNAVGEEVFEIVKAVTNNDALSWDEKKLQYIETVRNGPEGAKAVSTADKVHNMESLLIAYGEQGPKIWEHFSSGKEKKIWFEEAMLAMLRETWIHPLVDEYAALLEHLKSVAN